MGGCREHSTLTKLLCGGISAGLSKTITAPVERLKIILQTSTRSSEAGVLNTTRAILNKEGAFAFWKGNGMNCLRIVPTYALRLCLFDSFKSRNSDKSLRSQMVSGGYSGAITAVVVFPIDLVRTKLSADLTQRYSGAVDLLRNTMTTHGIKGFYQGFWISIVEITPYTAISLGGYAFINRKKKSAGSNGVLQKLMTGYFCGITASLFCYPIDTVKRRLMTSDRKVSAYTCAHDLIRKHGIPGLYRGCILNAMKTAPALAITLTTNDLLLENYYKRNFKYYVQYK